MQSGHPFLCLFVGCFRFDTVALYTRRGVCNARAWLACPSWPVVFDLLRCLFFSQVVQEMVEGYGLAAAVAAVGGGGGGAQRRGSVGALNLDGILAFCPFSFCWLLWRGFDIFFVLVSLALSAEHQGL